jgi:hypothetical protein
MGHHPNQEKNDCSWADDAGRLSKPVRWGRTVAGCRVGRTIQTYEFLPLRALNARAEHNLDHP